MLSPYHIARALLIAATTCAVLAMFGSGCAYKRVGVGEPIYYTEGGVPGPYQELRRVRGRGAGYCLNREGVYNTATRRALRVSDRIGGDGILIPTTFTARGIPRNVHCRWLLQIFLIPGGMGKVHAIAIDIDLDEPEVADDEPTVLSD